MTEPSHETPQEAYERGEAAGLIAARLAEHDKHFLTINGSLDKIATEMNHMTLALQRLGDQAVARDATVIATAQALKDADTTRWNPWAKSLAVLGGLVGVAGVLVAVLLH